MPQDELAVLLWQLLGHVILPLWLAAGLADYLAHARTRIATTSGVHESALHLLQTAQIGIPMLALLFLEANAPVLALLFAGAIAHTVTAYRDLRYAAGRRHIPVFEQFVHGFLVVLPLTALAIIAVLHWQQLQVFADPFNAAPGTWSLRWRDPPFAPATIVAVLGASFLFGVVPGLAEFARSLAARRRTDAAPGR
jgi:hypothetical protein